jgi:hypothetical protein
MTRAGNSWSLFLRYQAQAERNYRRAVEEFERLKALRSELPPELPKELPNEPMLDTQLQPEETTYTPPDTNPNPIHDSVEVPPLFPTPPPELPPRPALHPDTHFPDNTSGLKAQLR